MNYKHSTSNEVHAYIEASQIVSLLEVLLERRRAEHTLATAAVDTLGSAIAALKKGKAVHLDGVIYKQVQLFLVGMKHEAAKAEATRLAAIVVGISESLRHAKADQIEAHEDMLIKSRVKVISKSKNGLQVAIQVGGLSVTRHLERKGRDFTGTAFDGNGMMTYGLLQVLASAPDVEVQRAA